MGVHRRSKFNRRGKKKRKTDERRKRVGNGEMERG